MNATPQRPPASAVDIHIGGRVRLRRMMLGMSQERLGNRIGVTFQQIQKYEKGTNRIGGSRMAQIATALEVPVSFFYEDLQGGEGLVEGHTPDRDVSRVLEFVRSGEGMRLNRAFAEIKSDRLRRRLVALAEAMAGVDSPDEVTAMVGADRPDEVAA